MKKWKIPINWEMTGVVTIEADTLEEAIELAENDDSIRLPAGNYVDASVTVAFDDSEYIRECYNDNQEDNQ